MSAVFDAELFDDRFLAAINALSLKVRRTPPRSDAGVHLSGRTGSSLEFRDYAPYAPGDDLRRVDWAVYGRTKHLFVRRFERPTATAVTVLVDASLSMTLDETAGPNRLVTAARLAAAVAAAAVADHNPLRVVVADGVARPPVRPTGGRVGLMRALQDLSRAHAEAGRHPGPGLAAAIEAVLPLVGQRGPGVLFVVSDFFEPAGVDRLVETLRPFPGRLVLARVTRAIDAEPDVDGHAELVDCETDARLTVSADRGVLDRYRDAYRAYFDTLDAFAAARGAASVSFDASADVLNQLDRLFPGGTLTL